MGFERALTGFVFCFWLFLVVSDPIEFLVILGLRV